MADSQVSDARWGDPAQHAERIAQIRMELDTLNLQLLRLLEARGRLVREVMAAKQALGKPAFDPTRERQMLDALLSRATGVYPPAAIEHVFAAIFAVSRVLGAATEGALR